MMDFSKVKYFVGVDIQVRRGIAYAAFDRDARLFNSGWVAGSGNGINDPIEMIKGFSSNDPNVFAIGIDAPRKPLTQPRNWYWNGRNRNWRQRRAGEAGAGRHCEVIIKAHGIANPQWTRQQADALEWMELGFKLFRALHSYPCVYEVFPSASYNMLNDDRNVRADISFANFNSGPKDMLDACIAAVTVQQFLKGNGEAVGDGDGLGSIVLPRPIVEGRIKEVFCWPSSFEKN